MSLQISAFLQASVAFACGCLPETLVQPANKDYLAIGFISKECTWSLSNEAGWTRARIPLHYEQWLRQLANVCKWIAPRRRGFTPGGHPINNPFPQQGLEADRTILCMLTS